MSLNVNGLVSGGVIWVFLHPEMTPEHLGLIPSFLSYDDPRSAREQFRESYIGGWSPLKNTLSMDGKGVLKSKYEDEPDLPPLAYAMFRDEIIRFYEHAWVSITQADGSFEVSRMD
jgi:hypothetical protein